MMPFDFKGMVQRDRALFLNLDEYGEIHRVEGHEIPIIIDDDALKERQGGAALSIAESSLLIYAAPEDLPPRRESGASLNIDGREYLVDDWSEDMGIATIALSQNRTS